jgi:tetratricopeptide (TPR) repeat protein
MKRNPVFPEQFFKTTTVLLLIFALFILVGCSDTTERKKSYFDRGMELFDEGNYTKARLEFKNVLRIDPNDADAYYMFGQIEEKEENWRKAYALFFRAVEINPRHADAQVHLGTIYARAGDRDKALVAAEAALQVNPTHSSALVLRGFVKALAGESDAAIGEVLSAIESDPGNVEAASLLSALYADQGELDRAIRIAKDSLEQNRDRVASYLLLARLYAQAEKENEVVAVLSDLVKLKPDDKQNRMHLAAYYKQLGKLDEAESIFQEMVNEMPDDKDAKLALVSFLVSNGKVKKAGSLLNEYAGIHADDHIFKLELAKLNLNNQRYDEAHNILSDVITQAGLSQDGLKARNIKASALLKNGQYEEAKKLVEEVLKADPKNKDAIFVRAGVSLVSDDPDKGITDLRTLLRDDPGYVKAHRLKARAHLKKGEVELARQSLEDAIKIQPEEAATNFELVQLLIKTGELDDAVVVLEKMRRFAPKEITVLRGLAMVHNKQKHWGKLSELAKEIKTEHPDSPLGYYYQGISLREQGRETESLAEFDKALEQKPGSIEVLVAIAKSYYAMNKPDEARKRIEKVLESKPDHFLALNLIGEIYLSQKQFKEAESAFKQVIDLREDWPVPYKNLVKIKLLEGQKPEAIELLELGFDKTKDPILGIELANAKDKMGKTDESIQIYQSILDKHPKHLLAANNLVMILLRGEPDQASLDRALKLADGFESSNNPIVLDTLGWTYIKRGETNEAITVLKRAEKMDAGIPEIDYHLALVYYQQGDMSVAKKHLNAALAHEKPFEGVEEAKNLLQKIPD